MLDPCEQAARFYDLSPDHHPNDLEFYFDLLPAPTARVLELGCGTGRVTLPLAARCGFVHGIDLSEAMLAICRERLQAAEVASERVTIETGDITRLDLGRRFDLIIAPFRVIQGLETDAQLTGLFDTVRKHLADRGRCVLNAFHPNRSRPAMRERWLSADESLLWQVETAEGVVACYERHAAIELEPLVIYPELIYRRRVAELVVEEAVHRFPMRCFYPDELLARVTAARFKVTRTWGGYAGEPYGAGPELVVELGL